MASYTLSSSPTLALEKLDGSNLGIEIDSKHGLVALHGRPSLLWQTGDDGGEALDRKYGTVHGTLHPLQECVPKLVMLAQTILFGHPTTASSIVFYGEWFQDKSSGENAIPGWYPFGYAIRQSSRCSLCTMTQDLCQMFLDHCLLPLKLLYSGGGTLDDAVETLTPIMMAPPFQYFEGVLFTRATASDVQCSCKWKTAAFEEQPKWILDNVSDELLPMVHQLELVFLQKSDPKSHHGKVVYPPRNLTAPYKPDVCKMIQQWLSLYLVTKPIGPKKSSVTTWLQYFRE